MQSVLSLDSKQLHGLSNANLTLACATCLQALNELHLGPVFELETRYAQLLTTIFVCLGYSGGIPLLLPICFLHLLITYWVDKIAFVR